MTVSRGKLFRILHRDGNTCHYCHTELGDYICVDHKTPVVKGGTNDLGNLVLCCRSCNSKKGKKMYNDFILQEKINNQLKELGAKIIIASEKISIIYPRLTKLDDVEKILKGFDL